MPLRDHFRPPLDDLTSWEGFHGQWPAMIVLSLTRKLPRRYVAGPRVHAGKFMEIDVASFEKDDSELSSLGANGGNANPSLLVQQAIVQDEPLEMFGFAVRAQRVVVGIHLEDQEASRILAVATRLIEHASGLGPRERGELFQQRGDAFLFTFARDPSGDQDDGHPPPLSAIASPFYSLLT